jgi:plastocyanin
MHRTKSLPRTVLIHITNSKELIMRREFMVPFAWALTLGGMICISADKKSGERKPEAKPVTVAVNRSSYGPRDADVGAGDSVVWANKTRTKYPAKPDYDGRTLEAGEF